RRAVLARAAIDAIDVAVQLQTLQLGRRATRLAFAAEPAPAQALAVVQPLHVARHEPGEAGVVWEERGGVDPHRSADALADLAQTGLVGGSGTGLTALAMEDGEHVVDPRAVVTLLDLVVELVGLGQLQDTLGEEAVRARPQRLERTGGEPRRQRLRGHRRRG